MLRRMAAKRIAVPALLTSAAALLFGCSADRPGPPVVEAATSPAQQRPASSPTAPSSAFPYTDCDALVAGDALKIDGLVCEPGNARQSQTMDCKSGVYVRLSGSTAADLEGIAGSTASWREAEPIDPRYGRTPWAFNNCLEHG